MTNKVYARDPRNFNKCCHWSCWAFDVVEEINWNKVENEIKAMEDTIEYNKNSLKRLDAKIDKLLENETELKNIIDVHKDYIKHKNWQEMFLFSSL